MVKHLIFRTGNIERELKEYEAALQKAMRDFQKARDEEKQAKESLEKSNGAYMSGWIKARSVLEEFHIKMIKVTTKFDVLKERLKYEKKYLEDAKQGMDKYCK